MTLADATSVFPDKTKLVSQLFAEAKTFVSAREMIERRMDSRYRKVALDIGVSALQGFPLSRTDLLQLLHAGAVSDEAFESIVTRELDQLQDLLAGLVLNSLPDDSEVEYYVRSRGEHYVEIACHFRQNKHLAKAVLIVELHRGWMFRSHSLSAARMLPHDTPLPETWPDQQLLKKA
jgi:hypothetical protein